MGGLPLSAVLLDTHALVWLLAGNERLGVRSRKVIEEAAEEGGCICLRFLRGRSPCWSARDA